MADKKKSIFSTLVIDSTNLIFESQSRENFVLEHNCQIEASYHQSRDIPRFSTLIEITFCGKKGKIASGRIT